MATYTVVTIDANSVAGIAPGSEAVCRDANLRIWSAYVDGSSPNKIVVRYSDDLGATWSAAETVWTSSTPASAINWTIFVTMNAAGLPTILAVTSDTNGILFRTFRRESGSWSAKGTKTITGTPAMNQIQAMKWSLFQHPTTTSTWIVVGCDKSGNTGNNQYRLVYHLSTDDLATWGSPVKIVDGADVGATSTNRFATGGSQCAGVRCTSAGVIEGACYMNNQVSTGSYEIWAFTITAWNTSPVTTPVKVLGAQSLNAIPCMDVGIMSNGDVAISWSGFVSATQMRLHYLQRTSGTWGADSTTGTVNFHNPVTLRVWFPSDDTFQAILMCQDYGANSTFNNPCLITRAAATYALTEIFDEAKTHNLAGIINAPQLGVPYVKQSGVFLVFYQATDSDFKCLSSDTLAFTAGLPIRRMSRTRFAAKPHHLPQGVRIT